MDDELILPGMSERELNIRRRVHRLAEFYRHVFVYVIVIGGLWCINLWGFWDSGLPRNWYFYWAVWPTLGWGIGLVSHGLSVLPMWRFFSLDWEDRKVKKFLAREQDQATK